MTPPIASEADRYRAEADRLQDANDSLRTWVEMGEDEADRLRAEAEKWKEEYEDVAHACRAAEREADRYREALERIAGSRLLIHAEIAKLARAALEGSEDE